MSDRFSIEDILNEVKQMSGDTYIGGATEKKEPSLPLKTEPKEETTTQKGFSISEMSKEDFFSMLDSEAKSKEKEPKKSEEPSFAQEIEEAEESEAEEIVNGFTIADEFSTIVENESVKNFEKEENNSFEIAEEIPTSEEVESVEETVENYVKDVENSEKEPENLGKTQIFDKITLDSSPEMKKPDEEAEDFVQINPKRDHKPGHLLSADEISSGTLGTKPSIRFNSKMLDLTNGKKKAEDDYFAEEEIKLDSDSLFDELSKKYFDEKEAEVKEEPDVLENDIIKEEVKEIPYDVVIGEHPEPTPLEDPVKSTSDNRFSKKTIRSIEELDFDYSEEDSAEEVDDDYTSIEDEEDVRADLDITVKKASKRVTLTVVSFIFGLIVNVLPVFGADFIPFISPNENLSGFLIANAVVLLSLILINFSSFMRGIWSLVTLNPDADSPLSVATLFVIASTVLSLVPDFSAIAGKLPFYTAALQFGYILILIAKKKMAVKVRQNFRLVANTAVKKSCFIADERMCEMLENEDFIGTPYVATTKSVLNLHNFLKNSYCDDPSDNVSRIFSYVSLLASAVTLIFTYFASKDIVSALFYATAVSLGAAPVSVTLAVHSQLKKASDKFRQKDGLISGYEAVNNFSDVDCVIVCAEDIFPAGSVEMSTFRAIGDVTIEDVILKSAALTIAAGGPLADVFYKIIDGRRKMLSPVTDILYEDGFGLTGKIDGKIVRVGNREFLDSYGVFGLSDVELEEKAKKNGCFIVYTAIDSEVCGMFVLKYKSIDPDIEDAIYDLVANGITLAVKSNDPNITAELIAEIYSIPKEYVSVMEAGEAHYHDEITRPTKNGNSVLAFGGNSTIFASLVVACKKLKTKISVAVVLQAIFTIVGFALCMFTAVMDKGFDNINPFYIIVYQLITALITVYIPSFIKRIK